MKKKYQVFISSTYNDLIEERREVIQALRGGVPALVSGGNGGHGGRYSPPVASTSRAEHVAGIHRVKEYIAAGDVYQLVLSCRFAGRHGRHCRCLQPELGFRFCLGYGADRRHPVVVWNEIPGTRYNTGADALGCAVTPIYRFA